MRTNYSNALQLFSAAFLGLLVAELLGMHHPFWAAMPVWVVSQAYREDLLIRGALRVIGTCVGAALGLGALVYIDNPYVLVTMLAILVGCATGFAYWIGTIYSYGALLTAITSVVIVVPSFIMRDGNMLGYAVDRFWCTLIGVVSVTLITFYFTPRRNAPRPPRVEQHILGHSALRGMVGALATLAGALALVIEPNFITMSMAMALGIFSSLLGSSQDPRPIIRSMGPGVMVGVLAAVSYRYLYGWLEPGAFMHLVLIGAFIAAGALLRTNPKTAPLGLDGNMCFLLAGEVGAEIHHFNDIVLGGLALGVTALTVSNLYRFMPRRVTG